MAEKEYIERGKVDIVLSRMLRREKTTANKQLILKVMTEIRTIHSADIPHMVRCKHCKHSWFNGVSLWLCQREAKSYCPTVNADAFCSYGEQKEETP